MKKLLIILSLLLSGCATAEFEKKLICSEEEREQIVLKDEELNQRKKQIEEWQTKGTIPGVSFVILRYDEVMRGYVKSYNRDYDNLVYRSERFNKLCTK